MPWRRSPSVKVKEIWHHHGDLSRSWRQNGGRDRLGETETLPAGATRAFTLPPGKCLCDLRIVSQGDIAEGRRRVDACRAPSLDLPR